MPIQIKDYGITYWRIVIFFIFSIIAAFLEGFSLAMFLPLLQFIESNQNLEILSETSRLWEILLFLFNYLDLKITLISLAITVMLIMLFRVLAVYSRQLYIAWFSQEIRHQTRSNLFDAFLAAKYDFFDELSTGEVVNLASNETVRTSGFFASILQFISTSAVLLGMFGVLFWISWQMTLMVLVLILVSGLFAFFSIRKTKNIGIETTLSNKEMAIKLVEKLTTIRLVKLSGYELREQNHHRKLSSNVKDNLYKLSKINANIELIIEPIVILSGAALVILSINYYQMTLAQIGVFAVTLLRILPYSKEFIKSWQSTQASLGAIQAVNKALLSARVSEEFNEGNLAFDKLKGDIRFENVSYIYPSRSEFALSLINVTIPSGKMTALVGESGSGKSTFVDLIARLRECSSGVILFNDRPINEYSLKSVREEVSFVSQDAEILNDSVRNNLLFYSPDSTEDEMIKALEKTQAKDFVLSLPDGIDTIIGEKGSKLSGGEKQRLSMARAILKKASILILDEPTSAIDTKTEKGIQQSINSLRQKKHITIIVIAHRLNTIKNADQIIVLDKGKLVEFGTHTELLKKEAWYDGMFNNQTIS